MSYKDKEKQREYMKKWRKEHPEKVRKYNKKYKQENKKEIREYNKNYRQRPKVKIRRREYNKRWRKEYPEKVKGQNTKWDKENPDYMEEYNKKYNQEHPDYAKRYREENKGKRNENSKRRRSIDKNYNLITRLRQVFLQALKLYTKTGKIMSSKKYGISYKAIIEHLKPFPRDLKNYEIHHIKPLFTFNLVDEDGSTNLGEIRKAFAPENHKWLTVKEHRKINHRRLNHNLLK